MHYLIYIKMKIVRTSWGIANKFPDEGVIEVNENLSKYPDLYRAIMLHEFGHDNSVFSMKDLKHDLVPDDKIKTGELIKFVFKHPRSITQIFPFYYSRKRGFVLDINLSLIYIVFGIILGSTILLSLKYL